MNQLRHRLHRPQPRNQRPNQYPSQHPSRMLLLHELPQHLKGVGLGEAKVVEAVDGFRAVVAVGEG